ncbi:MAG: DUF1203 domain-containing protein [Rhodobacteraceae bacterium]|jgi:hypothetical protein|nr:DUF1203 domain-containing protein [Paracoccaceae bacterium]
MRPVFLPIPDAIAAHYRAGGLDANGLPPERRASDGDGIPCRHSLTMVPRGAPYLIVAHRPFAGLNPYTETGPIFLGAEETPGARPSFRLPDTMYAPAYILRGYSHDERILYGTGAVVPTHQIVETSETLLRRCDVAFLHIRSASNTCFAVRVERG